MSIDVGLGSSGFFSNMIAGYLWPELSVSDGWPVAVVFAVAFLGMFFRGYISGYIDDFLHRVFGFDIQELIVGIVALLALIFVLFGLPWLFMGGGMDLVLEHVVNGLIHDMENHSSSGQSSSASSVKP